MNFRIGYNYDAKKASDEAAFECIGKSLTLQSQGNDADINTIVKRFGLTGVAPQVVVPPTYGDFDNVSDYREALELVREADKSFMAMPAEVRSRFGNDAAAFVDFCSTPGNEEEMVELGLIVKPVSKPAVGDVAVSTEAKPK